MYAHKVPTEYFKKYEAYAQRFRPKLSPRMLGESPESLLNKYAEDPLLNNVPVERWRGIAADFRRYKNWPFNFVETVALLKHVARHYVLRLPPDFVA